MGVVSISLDVPQKQEKCASWISKQPPDVVAQVLSISETVYSFLHARGKDSNAEAESRRFAERLAAERKKHDELVRSHHEEIDAEKQRLTAVFGERIGSQAEHNQSLIKQNNELKERMERMEVEAEKKEAERVASMRSEFRQRWEEQAKGVDEKIRRLSEEKAEAEVRLREEEIRHEAALLQQRKEAENRMEEQRAEMQGRASAQAKEAHEAAKAQVQQKISDLNADLAEKLKQVDHLRGGVEAEYAEKLAAEKRSFEEYRAAYGAEMEKLREEKDARYAEMLATLKTHMADLQKQRDETHAELRAKEEAMQKVQEKQTGDLAKTHDEVLRVVQRMTGSSSAAVGRIGENFVFDVHSSLQLGTLTEHTHSKRPGYADATWRLDEIGLVGLTEVKYGCTDAHIHTTKDIGKFEADVRSGIEQGRINVAIILFLEKRIPNRPHISVDLKLGIPTIWASRDASDILPARTLVELAFRTMVEVFQIVRTQGAGSEGVVKDVANFVEEQVKLYDQLQKDTDFFVDGIHAQLRRANAMSASIAKLFSATASIRGRHPVLQCSTDTISKDSSSWWSTEEGTELLSKWRQYHATRGRHPPSADALELGEETKRCLRDSGIWAQAHERMKAEARQKSEGKRRRTEKG